MFKMYLNRITKKSHRWSYSFGGFFLFLYRNAIFNHWMVLHRLMSYCFRKILSKNRKPDLIECCYFLATKARGHKVPLSKIQTNDIFYIYNPIITTNQLINKLTNQPINQSTSHPINQSTIQPINKSTNQPINSPFSPSATGWRHPPWNRLW